MRGLNKVKEFFRKFFGNIKNIGGRICQSRYMTIVCTVFLVLVLCSGILLDSAYWKRCSLLADIVDRLKFLRNFGISYMGALKILGSNIGILMTVFSIFLTMNINVAERSEKKVYGVYRRELVPFNKQRKWLKWICYAAPILMIICLNLSYCVCGYLLISYCYLFLLIQYCRHESSYNRASIRKAMVKKLLECLSQESDWDRSEFLNYQILLENIGRSVQEEENWKEISELYDSLLSNINVYSTMKKVTIAFYFEQIVYWKENERKRVDAIEHLCVEIEKINKKTLGCKDGLEEYRPVLWGMLKVAVWEAKEEELIDFFQWFLDIPAWSGRLARQSAKKLSLEILQEETGVMLLFLEHRFRALRLGEMQLQMQRQIKAIWDYAEDSFLKKKSEKHEDIYFFYKNLAKEEEVRSVGLEKCLDDLQSDFRNSTKRSLIHNILFLEGSEKE